MLGRIQKLAPAILLFIGVATLFHRLLLGDVIYWGVPMLQFYPWEQMAFSQIRSGLLPLWNPMLGNGTPLLANYQTAVFYPLNWLYLIIPPEFAMGLIGVIHILWAGFGMRAFLRKVGIGAFGQSIGMLSFALGGYLISRFAFLSVTAAVAWLPWLMWAVESVLLLHDQTANQRRRAVVLAGVIALQILAGHAQSTFYSLVLACGYALWRLLAQTGDSPSHRWRTAITLALSGLLGFLIAAVQLLPTAEFLLASQRAAGMQREAGLTYSFWPWRFLTLIAPNLFGTPAADNFDGYGAYWEDAIYIGLLPLVMSGHAALRWLRERRAGRVSKPTDVVPFFLAVLPVVIVFALGKDSAIFVWLFDHKVPGFSTFQGPTRWMLLAAFSLGVLASIGADGWQSSDRGMFWTRLLTAGGVSLVLASLATLQFLGPSVRSNFVPAVLWLGVWVILGGALGLIQPQAEARPRWRSVWDLSVTAFVALDLVIAHWGLTPTITADYYHRGSQLAELAAKSSPGSRTFFLPDQEVIAKFGDTSTRRTGYLSLHAYDASDITHWNEFRNSLIPNLGMLDGIQSANNFDPLLVGAYASLLDTYGTAVDGSTVDRVRQMGVGVLLTVNGCGNLPVLGHLQEIFACKVPNPWPRASLASCVPSGVKDGLTCTSIDKPLQIAEERPNMVKIEVEVQGPLSTLLLLDTYYPGWTAHIDGQVANIYNANTAFRAVKVTQGSHTVEFNYDPPSFKIGAIITLVALAATAAIWTASRT